MARYRACVETQRSREDVFGYLSDFSTTREWDPGVLEAGRALDGRAHALPDDLSKPYSFLIVAFRREQQQLVDGWLRWLIELERERFDVAVYELPVLSARYVPVRWLIGGAMTRRIRDHAARARTITVYTDVETVVAKLGFAGTDTIAVVAVKPTGRILACETGGFAPRKAKRLAEILHRPVLEEPEQPSRVNAAKVT